MSKLTIKSGKNELTLQKSRRLVGLKTSETTGRSAESLDYIESEVMKNLGGFQIVTLKMAANDQLDDKLDEIRERDEVSVGTHVYFAEGSKRPIVPTGDIYIVFQEGVSEAEQLIVLETFRLALIERRSTERVLARVTPDSPNPFKVGHALQQISLVKFAEPDLDTILDEYTFALPNDDLLSHQWFLQNNGFVPDTNYPLRKGADAKVVDAWQRLGNMGKSDITIALIDNGFDLTHPDLKGKIVKPFDLWNQSSEVLQGDPRYTHGTPCASLALATSNGQGMLGAAPNARFMPVSGTSYANHLTEQMFDHCVRNGADIISCSWGTTDPAFSLGPIKEQAITRAAKSGRNGKGCVILFAVGNDDLDFVNFYAAHPDVIAVAACTSRDEYAVYSNRGREVSVCAPSNGDWPLVAARAWWDAGMQGFTGNRKYWYDGVARGQYYKHFGGTSGSTPLVAGICALMLSANPDLAAREVKDILQQTADKIGPLSEYVNGHSVKYGYGRVNADKAVLEALRRADRSAAPVLAEVRTGISSGKGLFRFQVQKQAPEGWGVQIGAFYDYGNVLIQAERLQSQFGQPVIVGISELEGKTVYKVVVGAFADVNAARALQQRMEAAGVKGFARHFKDV
ncbi:MAG TPA: S8 family serine peptidase [Saprospiraceae bacterium]|nr:S8 family serine peptidase [Saprospiraceae bacterium]